jgi:hypothetical protein
VADYLDTLAGAVLLVACAPLAWLASRRSLMVAASAVAAGATVIWAAAPATGQPDTPVFDVNVVSTTRYAVPALAAAAVALALAASARTRLAVAARAVLAAGLLWNVVRVADIGPPALPGVLPLLAVAAIGAAFGASVGGRVPFASGARTRFAAVVFAAAVLGAALSVPASGLAARNADVVPGLPGAPLVRWATEQAGFEHGQSIYFVGTVFGGLTGDQLQNRLVLMSPRAACSEVRARATSGLLVVAEPALFRTLGVPTAAHCAAGLRPSFEIPGLRVYGSLRVGSAGTAAGPRG